MVRRVVRPLAAVAAGASLLAAACADVAPVEPGRSPSLGMTRPGQGVAAGRYIVAFEEPTDGIPADVLAASGGQVVDAAPAFNAFVVDGVTNPDALRAASPKYIEAEFEMTLDDPKPDDVPEALDAPWYASAVQWDMQLIKADRGWQQTNGGAGANICIVDTGVDDTHQELAGKVLLRTNFVAGATEQRVDDPNGHGTHVAGTAGAKGEVISGVAPRASILSARVLNTAGSGTETAIANGIRWCADNGAHVINMSLGGIRYRGQSSYITSPQLYGAAINYANALGALTVTSAGNSNLYVPNPALLTVPSAVPNTITVGSTGPLTKSNAPAPPAWSPFDPNQVWEGPDTKAYYSNFGPAIDVFAPGGRLGIPLSSPYRFVDRVVQGGPNDGIWSACSSQSNQSGPSNVGGVPVGSASCVGQTGRYVAYQGTSQAAPHVTGMAAVLYAELGGVRSDANRQRVLSCITGNTDNIGPSSIYGGGRVNLEKALAALRSGAC